MARQLARRRRHERAAGAAIAALGIVVLVVAIFALRHPRGQGTVAGSDTHVASSSPSVASTRSPSAGRSSSAARPPASARSIAQTSARAATRMSLVVLNDTAISGLAQQASNTFQAGGWSVTQIGNLQNSILSSCAYYDPAVPGARESASLLRQQFPAIKRVHPKFDGLPAGPIVVVLTPDYPSG